MKLVKLASALSLVTVLAACSTANDVASSVTDTVKNGVNTVSNGVSNTVNGVKNVLNRSSKSVVYQCQNNKTVVANYEFEGEKATAVTLSVNNVAVKSLKRDENNQDFASFASDSHTWNVDNHFNLATFDKTEAGMLFNKGKQADEILAKNCEVNKTATAKLNK